MLPLTTFADSVDTPDPALNALVDLHTRTVDNLMGYEKMLEKAEPEFRTVVEAFRDLHTGHASALASILSSRGYQVDAEGSLMGMINKAVVTVRSLFDDIDSDVLTAIHRGEEHTQKAFDDALMQPLAPGEALEIGEMRDELIDLLGDHPVVS